MTTKSPTHVRQTGRTILTSVLPGASAALVLMAILPGDASACAVCFDTTAENRMAFMQTTALLSLLPLVMVGGAGAWIRKRARELAEEFGDDESGPRGEP